MKTVKKCCFCVKILFLNCCKCDAHLSLRSLFSEITYLKLKCDEREHKYVYQSTNMVHLAAEETDTYSPYLQ